MDVEGQAERFGCGSSSLSELAVFFVKATNSKVPRFGARTVAATGTGTGAGGGGGAKNCVIGT
jgi:hypothetical protein